MPYADNGDVRIHYELEGSGPPLVLQHGFTDSLASWYDNGYVEPLKREYTVILVDARGHGQSDKPHEVGAYAMEKRATDIVAVLDEARFPRAHYFGYSMGGWIGYGMAKYAPNCVNGLVIGAGDPGPRRREGYPLLQPDIMRQGTAAIIPLWDAPLPPALQERILANDIEAIRASRGDDPGYLDMLSTITNPCLLVCGDADVAYPPVQAAAAQIPNARMATIPGLNHVQTRFRSDLVLPHVMEFLRTATTPR
jgi:pimeloyl-ACP methyl ester carboxylesterase